MKYYGKKCDVKIIFKNQQKCNLDQGIDFSLQTTIEKSNPECGSNWEVPYCQYRSRNLLKNILRKCNWKKLL